MRGLDRARQAILEADEVLVSGHVNPDGDSIGSLLSLGLGIERMGKRVHMVSCDGVPKRYRRLPSSRRIVKRVDRPVDLAIAVDCSSREILGRTFDAFRRARRILEIDHHDFRRPFGDERLIDTKAAAVGELIYLLLRKMKVGITDGIAQNLLTSIIVETESFGLPSVRPLTFEIAAELTRSGVDFYKLVDMVFWSRSKASVVLSGLCLSRCRFLKKGKVAWSTVRMEDFAAAGGKDEDVDPVADEMRAIKGVAVAILFREKDRETVRVSLRSKGKINIAAIAERYNGGGHFDVAGCSIPNSAAAIEELLSRAGRLV